VAELALLGACADALDGGAGFLPVDVLPGRNKGSADDLFKTAR
jgi:hypothetical protein